MEKTNTATVSIEDLLAKPSSELTNAELKAVMDHREKHDKKKEEAARKEYQKDKEDFITYLAGAFQEQKEVLTGIKETAIKTTQELLKRIYEINGKELKTQKTFAIKDEKDTMKVVLDTQERFEFTEEAQVHINAIKELFKAKFEDRNKGFYNLLDSILMRNSKGDYDAKLLTKAKSEVKKLEDEALILEFDKLQDCLRVVGSATYLRVYAKNATNKWEDISLNFSSL